MDIVSQSFNFYWYSAKFKFIQRCLKTLSVSKEEN